MAVLAAVALAFGCGERPAPRFEPERPPAFEDYPAGARWEGTPAVPDLASHPDGSRFGAALWQGSRRGPNFAGRYTIVSRRCGRLCREFAIVDAETGRVHPGLSDTPPFAFRLDSRLIVFEAPTPEGGATYYVWNDPRLEIVPPGSWAGVRRPPEGLRRFIDSVRALERPGLDDAAPLVTRPSWDRVVIAARDGARIELQDEIRGGVVARLHVFRGRIRGSGKLLVETIVGATPRFLAIDPLTGLATDLDVAPPVAPVGCHPRLCD